MSKYIKADYLKSIMKNDRLLQGNCEYELWAQQVNKYVDSLPSIELADRKTEPQTEEYEEPNYYDPALWE